MKTWPGLEPETVPMKGFQRKHGWFATGFFVGGVWAPTCEEAVAHCEQLDRREYERRKRSVEAFERL